MVSALEDNLHKLKLVLDETVTFPSEYYFKFIVPVSEIHQILFLMNDMHVEQKPSSKGHYISVSGKKIVKSSDEIITIYQRASVIKGIVSL
jgi:putative lipoic acid-binding regulatory protein